ncbi:YqgE/AlgH family protein [Paludisphaera mucosa]|uniref:YqgE/AlgH family protein n=1 Tax=Paludisphaera mucosa TaxID=3030827 RepID=A0ABT6FL12_9BACT|nr:YqgE/AlgH family protein [Paludisphaera mucosa]MDG3008068.1 YqgE/AlgH family protein [Paludisphaera mucosa]
MNHTSLKGQLLIAAPKVESAIFARSVVLILEHDEEKGAKGIILNLPTSATMTDLAGKLFDEGFAWDKPLHLGGPVAGPLLVLHTRPKMADLEIVSGVYVALDATKSQHLITQEIEPSLIIANFSGWAPGQLERELEDDVWIVAPADTRRIFGGLDQDLWWDTTRDIRAETLRKMLRLRHQPVDASLN